MSDKIDRYIRMIEEGKRDQIPLSSQKVLANENVMLTTETGPFNDFVIEERFLPVHAVAVLGTIFFRDWLASWRDVFGGRTRSSQNILDKAIVTAQQELQHKAWLQGANIVVGYSLNISEVSSKGKAGFTVVVTGSPLEVIYKKPESQ